MTEHIDRMKVEHKELTVKIEAFVHGNDIFKTLCDLEQTKNKGMQDS